MDCGPRKPPDAQFKKRANFRERGASYSKPGDIFLNYYEKQNAVERGEHNLRTGQPNQAGTQIERAYSESAPDNVQPRLKTQTFVAQVHAPQYGFGQRGQLDQQKVRYQQRAGYAHSRIGLQGHFGHVGRDPYKT